MEVLKTIGKACALVLAGLSLCRAEQIVVDSFGYLNNSESPVIIDQFAAQDLLNVDITSNGKSVKKRAGYGTYKTLSGSQAIHGGIHYFDASGNDIQVWGSSTSLWGIVADATAVQLVSSATLNTTWDCADTQGFAYCVNSSRNALIKTNGATQTWSTSPLGTMIAVTPERLLVAGVAATPSTIHYSAANDFTNFTVGITPDSASSEAIAAPGSRITHLEYACGRWLWWKDLSFGYAIGTDQTNLSVKIVSSNIGSRDNSSAIDPDGNVYFRGQDGHIYKYDCNSLTRLTTDITPAIQTSGSRTSNSYTQTSQTDWQTGTIVPTGQLSTTIASGDVMPSSFTATDTSSADFSQGTVSNTLVTSTGVVISTNNTTYGGAWTLNSASDWDSSFQNPYTNCGTMADKGGDGFVALHYSENSQWSLIAELIETNTSVVISSVTVPFASNSCTWTQRTLTVGASHARKRARIKFSCSLNATHTYQTSDTVLLSGTNITFWTASDLKSGIGRHIFIDGAASATTIDDGVSTITTGSFTSRAFNSAITNSYVSLSYNATINDLTPTFAIHDSTGSTGPWAQITTSTNTSVLARQYIRYISTFTVAGSSDAATSLDDVTLISRSSGTYYSPVVNKPNLTSWDTFNVTSVNNNGTHTFYLRSSTNSFTVVSATPSWTAQTSGQVISISTGTYLQFRDDFGVSGSTHNPTLSDFTINWFEGVATDKAYAIYHDLAVWWSVAYGSGQTTNNYIFKYDLLNGGWTLYNFGAGGFLLQNNLLYFGTTAATGKIYRYGDATSDDGTSINAYWQSKDFPGSDPFLENEYKQFDLYARRNPSQTLTVGYTLNSSTTTTSFTVQLSSSTDSTIRWKKLLPTGKNGGLINVKFSDTSSADPWEVLGYRLTFSPLPYRPTP